MASSSSRALATEIIIRHVFETVENPRTLAVCARVNRTWHFEAISVLWRGASDPSEFAWRSPCVEDLARLAQIPERFSFYVGFIRFLDLKRELKPQVAPIHSIFESKLWSKATPNSISVDIGSELMLEQYMASILLPSVQSLSLFGGYYSDKFFILTKRKAPQLVSLLIDNRGHGMTSRGFLSFLEDMPNIRSLELLNGFESVMTEPVMIHLFGRPNLEHLALGDGPTFSKYILSQANEVAPTLSSLRLSQIDDDAARWLLPRLKRLEKFHLELEVCSLDLSKDILRPLSQCSLLRDVSLFQLVLKEDSIINAEDLVAIGKGNPYLRSFEIGLYIGIDPRPTGQYLPSTQPLPSDAISDFAKATPKLETLCMEYPCDLDVAQLCLLGRYWQSLKKLAMNAKISLLDYDKIADKASFPSMKNLTLRSFLSAASEINPEAECQERNLMVDDRSLEERQHRIFQDWMPHLQDFDVFDSTHRDVAMRVSELLQH